MLNQHTEYTDHVRRKIHQIDRRIQARQLLQLPRYPTKQQNTPKKPTNNVIKENNKSTVIICELWLLYSPFNNFNCLSAIVSAVSTLCVGQCIACTANKALCFSVFSYVMRCSVVHSFSNKSSVLSHPSQHQIYDWQVLGGRK